MRRFLVVGCGGSGGATLAYMMDQLRSDLAAHGVDKIPAGWQFISVDVPSGSEDGPDGLGSVQQQGGAYFGSGPQTGSYSVLDNAVTSRYAAAYALDATATWAPRKPDEVGVPISAGAGQYRAVGRMITLNKATEIRDRLQHTWDQLFRVETVSEMSNLKVPGLGEFNSGHSPLILVVSSMAGGAGASMALDVCRLLTLVTGVDPAMMGVFMVTPNIFDSLPEGARSGVRANALAMLGEIVASQTGAAREHDVSTLAALGLHNGEGASIPFARVFPVGRFVGPQRALFGDGSQNAVYRGLARGLAGLMMSGAATAQFMSFDLGNTGSPPGNRDYLGWGDSPWDALPWGSYGFASLSMGRDRYAEYAAQRLARSSADKLMFGHLAPTNPASGTEQVKALLDSQWPAICGDLGLPIGVAGDQAQAHMGQWLTQQALPSADGDRLAHAVVETNLRSFLPASDGVPANQWVPMLRQAAGNRRAALTQAAQDAAYGWAYIWHQDLARRTETVVAGAIAQFGLPYARALVERLGVHLNTFVLPGAQDLSRLGPNDVAAMPAEVEPVLGMLKGTISNGAEVIERILGAYRGQLRQRIYAAAAGLVEKSLGGFTGEFLSPLVNALAEAQRILEDAAGRAVQDLGLARLATDQSAAWPADSEERVQARFAEADNEVMLTSSSDFKTQYEVDLPRSVGAGAAPPHLATAIPVAARQVISGVWATTGGVLPPRGLLECTSQWQSKVFPVDPDTGERTTPALSAFDVHIRPAELLGRARLFIDRPGESFDDFCKVSLRDYVMGVGGAESELTRRRDAVITKFQEALSLARPLISVNDTAVQELHGTATEYRYKFAEVPFKGLDVGDQLIRLLDADPRVDQPAKDNLRRSMTDEGGVTRIDIFGSYPNYSPLVFDSVLEPAKQQWARTPAQGRGAFWRYRRTRPLAAALPMTQDERRAMTAGWFLGQLTGRIQIPESPFNQPVRIWDADASRWLDFPNPLLTPPSQFSATYDWLPAVLESVLLAIASSHEQPVMGSLVPYRTLRGLWDSHSQAPATGIVEVSAKQVVLSWLSTGATGSGLPSRVPGVAEATTVDDRAQRGIEWLTQICTLAGDHFMAPGLNGARGGGQFSVISARNQASMTPIFRDLAPDVHWATGQLIDLVSGCVEQAKSMGTAALPHAGGAFYATTPAAAMNDVVIPEGGVF
ncbi:tubulin-like doman-containing protein [Prescottella agglutinans]|uniref:Tubulin-like protein n=1 Tax=Prescottella agglutinans TaxID=1644129 RepID=A0ABT6MIF9_9NOCA|nr:hypothetical protein [Prescottella agglutinans]